jgi:hypothetical protein
MQTVDKTIMVKHVCTYNIYKYRPFVWLCSLSPDDFGKSTSQTCFKPGQKEDFLVTKVTSILKIVKVVNNFYLVLKYQYFISQWIWICGFLLRCHHIWNKERMWSWVFSFAEFLVKGVLGSDACEQNELIVSE